MPEKIRLVGFLLFLSVIITRSLITCFIHASVRNLLVGGLSLLQRVWSSVSVIALTQKTCWYRAHDVRCQGINHTAASNNQRQTNRRWHRNEPVHAKLQTYNRSAHNRRGKHDFTTYRKEGCRQTMLSGQQKSLENV